MIIIATNPFAATRNGDTFDLLNQYEKINDNDSLNNLSENGKKDLVEDYIYIAKQMAKYDKYDKAIEVINKAINIDPTYDNIYSNIADLYIARALYKSSNNRDKAVKTSDFLKAIEYSQKNIDTFPDSPRSYNSLTNTYVLVKDYNSAINAAKTGCYANAKFENLCQKVSDLYLIQRKRKEAVNFYKDLIEKRKNSDVSWIYKNIGIIYKDYGVCSESSNYLEVAYNMHSNSENLKALTSPCYNKSQKISKALP